MRPRLASAAILALALPILAARKPKLPLPAAQYPFHDTHAADHVTIAAEPGDTKQTRPDTRLDYFDNLMLPIRVIVTNDADEPLSLDEARIHFIAADLTVVPAATLDDLQRRLAGIKSATGTKVPLPLPLPPITIHHDIDKKIQDDDTDFGFQTTTVKPHTTVAGYLYYDMEGLDRPPLDHATLELRRLRFTTSNRVLENFEIPLKPSETDAKH